MKTKETLFMKAMLFIKSNRLTLIAFTAFLFSFTVSAFAQNAPTAETSGQFADIKKKLDESQKREEQILANQEKILSEILISRKWAKHG